MSTATEEIIEVCGALPPEKREEVADFAKFLLARQGDERWEQTINDPRPLPKLEAFFSRSRRRRQRVAGSGSHVILRTTAHDHGGFYMSRRDNRKSPGVSTLDERV